MKVKDLIKKLEGFDGDTDVLLCGSPEPIYFNSTSSDYVSLYTVCYCQYCGEESGSTDPDILCPDCALTFGHSKFSEL